MGELKKKKKSESNEKVEHQDTAKVEKKKPVKVFPKDDNIGGIFSSKLVEIIKRIKESING